MGTQLGEPTGPLPPGPTDESAELQQARAGDLAAFGKLVVRHQAMVFSNALRITGQRDDALELAHEVFLRLHSALPRIRSAAHLKRWLSRLVPQPAEAPESVNVELDTDPGADFATRVVAHVELRWSHRRREAFAGNPADSPQSRRLHFILPAAFAAATIAVVVLTLWLSGALRRPLVADVVAPVSPAAASEPGAIKTPAVDSAVPAHASVNATDASLLPVVKDPYRRYTVIAMPPRHDSQDPAARASVEAFYGALLGELRAVPGIALLIPGVTAPPTDIDRPADYLLTMTSLDTTAPASGGLGFRVTDGGGAGAVAAPTNLPSGGFVTLVGGRSDASRAGSLARPQWPVEIRVQPIGQPDSGSFTSILQIGADNAQLAAQQAEVLRLKVFPDALMKLQLLARIRDGALSEAERSAALADLLGTQSRGLGESLDSANINTILEQTVAMRADQRAQLWRSLRRISHPDLVDPLLDSMRRDTDEGVRYEALATLAADYGSESKVRAAMEVAARQDPEQIVRMAARRVLHGDAEWRAYVVATLRDEHLSFEERLAPLLVAARSAATPAESLGIRTMLGDEQVLNPLVDLVRDGWFEAAEADTISNAVNLLANAENPAAFDLFVQVLQDQDSPRPEPPPRVAKAAPQVSAEGMAWLLNHRNDPRVRRILTDIADGKVNEQLVATVEQMRKFEPPQLPPQLRQRIPRRQ